LNTTDGLKAPVFMWTMVGTLLLLMQDLKGGLSRVFPVSRAVGEECKLEVSGDRALPRPL